MRVNDLSDTLKEITSSYFVVENRFYKANGEKQVAYQYVAGMDSKRAYTTLQYDKYGNEYVAVNDDDYKQPFCYSWLFRNKKHLDVCDYMFFNIENPKDLVMQILKFLDKNKNNIEIDKLFYLKQSIETYLKHDNNTTLIAEILTDATKWGNNQYIHFNYRNIDVFIKPITEKTFNLKTERYNKWVDEDIANNVEI